jgi:hypothetical protein
MLREIDTIIIENWQLTSLDKERTAYIKEISPGSKNKIPEQVKQKKLKFDKIRNVFTSHAEAYNLPPLFKLSFLVLKHAQDSEKVLDQIEEDLPQLIEFLSQLPAIHVHVFLKSLSSQDIGNFIFCKIRLLSSRLIKKYPSKSASLLLRILKFVFLKSHNLSSLFKVLVSWSKNHKSSTSEKLKCSFSKKRSLKHRILLNPSEQRHFWTRLQLDANCRKNLPDEENKKLHKFNLKGSFSRALMRSNARVREFLDGDQKQNRAVNILGHRRVGNVKDSTPAQVLRKSILYAKLLRPERINLKRTLQVKLENQQINLKTPELYWLFYC